MAVHTGRREDLIAADGDIAGVLGISPGDFHHDWFAFARAGYGF